MQWLCSSTVPPIQSPQGPQPSWAPCPTPEPALPPGPCQGAIYPEHPRSRNLETPSPPWQFSAAAISDRDLPSTFPQRRKKQQKGESIAEEARQETWALYCSYEFVRAQHRCRTSPFPCRGERGVPCPLWGDPHSSFGAEKPLCKTPQGSLVCSGPLSCPAVPAAGDGGDFGGLAGGHQQKCFTAASMLPGASSGSGRHPAMPASAFRQCHLAATTQGWDTCPWLEAMGPQLPPGGPRHLGDREGASLQHCPPRCRGACTPRVGPGERGLCPSPVCRCPAASPVI